MTIFIVSPRNLFSELLARTLREEAYEQCDIIPDISTIISSLPRKPDLLNGAALSSKTIVLVDCVENDFDKVANALPDHEVEPNGELIVAIYNVYPGWGIEEEALKYGIKGFFYKQDGLGLLLKGITAILGKEIWVSREILMRSAMGGLRHMQSTMQEKTGLSMREIEILRLAVTGAPNEEIGQRLFISPNTVKTHLYKIYKKINVSNRLKAASWVSKNL